MILCKKFLLPPVALEVSSFAVLSPCIATKKCTQKTAAWLTVTGKFSSCSTVFYTPMEHRPETSQALLSSAALAMFAQILFT